MYCRNTTDFNIIHIDFSSVEDADLSSIYGVRRVPDKDMNVYIIPMIDVTEVNEFKHLNSNSKIS